MPPHRKTQSWRRPLRFHEGCKKIGPGEALVLAAEVDVTQDLLQALRQELVAGHPVLATARSLAALAELWNLPPAMHQQKHLCRCI